MNLVSSVHYNNISETKFQQYSDNDVLYTPCDDSNTKDIEMSLLKRNVKKLENDIKYLEEDHTKVLQGLQHEIEELRQSNQDLQFELVMRTNRNSDSNDLPLNQTSELNHKNITNLKKLLEEEKTKNQKLMIEIHKLTNSTDDSNQSDSCTSTRVSLNETIEVDSNIRITLHPLQIVGYDKDSSLVFRKPTLDECQSIIGTLLSGKIKLQQLRRNDEINEKAVNLNSKSGSSSRKYLSKMEGRNSSTPNNLSIDSRLESANGSSCNNATVKLSPIANPPKLSSHSNSSNFQKYSKITGSGTLRGYSGQSHQQNLSRMISPVLMNTNSSNESTNNNPRSFFPNPGHLLPITNITASVPSTSASNRPGHSPDIQNDTSVVNKLLLPAQPRPNLSNNQAERRRRLQSIQKNRINQLQDKF